MKTLNALMLLLAVGALASCGDDKAAGTPDGRPAPVPDATPVNGANFETFVKDLVENHTSDREPPVAIDFTISDSQTPGEFTSLFQ